MKRNARTAYNQLKKLGAPLLTTTGYNCEFAISGELRTNDDTYFADYWREELREYVDKDGVIQNPPGVRTDVANILEANGLYGEWINGGLLGVYQA